MARQNLLDKLGLILAGQSRSLLASLFVALLAQTTLISQSGLSETAVLRVIVVSSEPEAQQIIDRLKRGEDFGVLAKSKSIDPYAQDYGYLGKVNVATLRPELREAIRGLSPGQITNPIKVPGGYAILKLLPASEASIGQGMSINRDLPLSGKGSIVYPADVAGQVIADLAFQKYPKPDGWDQDLNAVCEIRKQSLSTLETRLQNRLYSATPDSSFAEKPVDLIQAHYALAQIKAYKGDMEKATAEWEAAYRIAVAKVPAGVLQLEAVLGIAYLHKSEMENGVYRDPDELCIFPPHSARKYNNIADSLKAIDHLSAYLDRKPEDLQTKWLLNLAYMTMGKYPAGVPNKYLIPPAVFESKQDIGRFVDVAPLAGLNLVSMANGVVVDDFDNDGLLDVMISSFNVCEPLRYFHNNGDGTFTDRAAVAGLTGQLGGLNMIQADYNNDGCMDLLVLHGAWEFPVRKSLLRNNCDGTFTDVTKEAGLAEPATRTQAAVWVDIDNDGFIDLFVGNENGPSQLFHNRGDGTFEDISHSSGVDKIAFTKGVVAADYDNDGYADLFVSNLYDGNFLYHNNHNRTFTEVARKAGVQLPDSQSFASWFFDYDNDGWPDLLVNSYFFSLDETLRSYLGLPHSAETLKLFKNMKDGTFKDITAEVGLDKVYSPMGANFGDVDNDGFLDIYLGTGGPEYGFLFPKVLLRNQGGKSFVDISSSAGIGDLHKGHGTAFADLENTGQEDIATSMGGATPGDAHAFRVFENPGNDNDWINVKLVGVKTNRAAIGAQIKITVKNQSGAIRSIFRTVSSGGSFGASPLAQHIGLGKSARIVNLEIFWPASKTSQSFSDIAPNRFIQISEFAKDYKVLTPKQFHFAQTTHVTSDDLDQQALTARRLKILDDLDTDKQSASPVLKVGQRIPSAVLTDQNRAKVDLAGFTGKVVLIDFIYTHCPLPDYCFRLSNNLGNVQTRFQSRMGRDLVLLSVTFDPVHDQPEVLANYARTWNAGPDWHFLTGTVPDVRRVCKMFGVDSWPDEAELMHSLHTVIIDRQGRLAANLEGNLFTAQQLGDLIQTILDQPR